MTLHTLTNDQWLRWTTHKQVAIGHLVIWVPDLVVKRRVNQAGIAYPLSSIAFDNPDGEPGDPLDMEAGMLVKFYDATTEVYKGATRLLRGASGSILTIHPVGMGDLEVADNDIFEVYDDYPPYALIPYISADGILYKNYDLVFDDQTADFPPVANAVVDRYADHIDPVTAVITVKFNASTSFGVADGATISSYLWDVKDGTITVGSTSTASITATFPAGKRWVKLTVTDSNGVSSIKRIPIWAANDTTFKTYKARASRRGYNPGIGWEASFDLLDDDLTLIPDHALVIFYRDEWFGDTRATLRDTNTGFFGWITGETLHLEPLWSDSAVNAQGPLAILQQRPAFAQTVRRADTPTTWAEVTGLDWWKTVIYLLMWHSNMLELVNIERPGFYADYPVPRLDSEAGTLYNQVDFLAKAVFGQFTCDASGCLYLRRNPHYMNSAERSAHIPITALDGGDLVGGGQGPQFERRHWDSLAWLKSSALIAHATTSVPLLAISPGTTPGQGVQIDSLDRILVLSQTDFNERAGHVYAYRQSKRLGQRVMRQGTLTLAHGGLAFDPAWGEVATLTLPASSNRRGFTFSLSRIVPTALDIIDDYEHQAVLERLTIEEECRGYAAATVPVPTDTVDDYPPTDSDPPDIPEVPTDDYGDGKGSGLMALKLNIGNNTQAGGVVYTTTLSTGDYTRLETGLPYVPNGSYNRYAELVDVVLDPHNPAAAWAVTQNHWTHQAAVNNLGAVLYNTDWRAGTAWTEAVSHTALNAAIIAAGYTTDWFINDCGVSMAGEGLMYLLCNGTVTGVGVPFFVVRIAGYGSSIAVSKPLYGGNQHFAGKIWVGSGDANKLFIAGKWAVLGHTDVWATTWTAIAAATVPVSWDFAGVGDERPGIVCPYLTWDGAENNEQEIYVHFYDSVADSGFIYRSVDAGVSFASYVASGSYNLRGGELPSSGTFSIYAFRPDQAAMMLGNDGDLLLLTAGDPTLWTEKSLPIHTGWMGGWPALNGQFYVGGPTVKGSMVALSSSVLQFTDDGCETWSDWTYNLWTLYPDVVAAGAVDGSMGVVRLTPYWMKE